MSDQVVLFLIFYGTVSGILVLIYLQERKQGGLERKLREIVKSWKRGQIDAANRHRKWYQRFFSKHN